MNRKRLVVSCLGLVGCLPAQSVFLGNGVPSAYITNTPAVVNQELRFELGSPTAPGGVAGITLSGGLGPTTVPLIGQVGIDVFSPFYFTRAFFLDAQGDAGLVIPLPPGVVNTGLAALYANNISIEAGLTFSVSKTVRVEFANPDAWEPVGNLLSSRQMHSATPLGAGPRDNVTQVLVAGGLTGSIIIPAPMASAELYDPLTRTVSALPNMSLPRAAHQAVRLQDGRVLLCGGVSTARVPTATCELFDPTSQQFVAAASMGAPRAGHQLTLLDDGRVLATGGVANWQHAAVNFIGMLNTAQDTTEVFDPATNTWSPGPVMAARRFGHTATKMPDGKVLLVCGISGGSTGTNPLATGGQVPVYTPTCELFDPATNSLSTWPPVSIIGSLPFAARGFHAASLLPNGELLVTGGFIAGPQNGEAIATSSTFRWDSAVASWQSTPNLPAAVGIHSQLPFGDGALVTGGFTGDLTALQTVATNVFHDGGAVTPLATLGTDGIAGQAAPRGGHTCTKLYDGTYLVYGGGQWPATLLDGFVYTPSLQ